MEIWWHAGAGRSFYENNYSQHHLMLTSWQWFVSDGCLLSSLQTLGDRNLSPEGWYHLSKTAVNREGWRRERDPKEDWFSGSDLSAWLVCWTEEHCLSNRFLPSLDADQLHTFCGSHSVPEMLLKAVPLELFPGCSVFILLSSQSLFLWFCLELAPFCSGIFSLILQLGLCLHWMMI